MVNVFSEVVNVFITTKQEKQGGVMHSYIGQWKRPLPLLWLVVKATPLRWWTFGGRTSLTLVNSRVGSPFALVVIP